MVNFSLGDLFTPQVLAAEKDFLLVYKPPRMHTAPLPKSAGDNLLAWCAARFPEVAELPGRKAGEGGLLHRLDYETQGLVLIARNNPGMQALLEQQSKGMFQKEYSALVPQSVKFQAERKFFEAQQPSFPALKPELPDWVLEGRAGEAFGIVSSFRSYGPRGKIVRPVLFAAEDGKSGAEDDAFGYATGGKRKDPYVTEIVESRAAYIGAAFNGTSDGAQRFLSLRLKIHRGFRHQIRAHLAWAGIPILNDRLYGGASAGKGLLALRASSLSFSDPSSHEELHYSIPSFGIDELF